VPLLPFTLFFYMITPVAEDSLAVTRSKEEKSHAIIYVDI